MSTPTVFLSWSGKESQRMASAYGTLLHGVFGDALKAWQSTRDIKGIAPWRQEIQEGVQKAEVVVLALGASSLASKWLMYEAGAFFRHGKTFVLGCGVTDKALDASPLRDLQVWDCGDKAKVARLTASIGEIFGTLPADFDQRFDAAWPAFKAEADGIRRDRRKRRWTAIAAAPAAVTALAALLTWALRPPAPCSSGTNVDRTDCEWARFVESKRAGANANVHKMISRRPFAVVTHRQLTGTDDAQRPTTEIVRPGGRIANTQALVVFAPSGYDTDKALDAAVVFGDVASPVLVKHALPYSLTLGDRSITIEHVGTLSDDHICDKLLDLERTFPKHKGATSSQRIAGPLATFLASFNIGTASQLETDVRHWIRGCLATKATS